MKVEQLLTAGAKRIAKKKRTEIQAYTELYWKEKLQTLVSTAFEKACEADSTLTRKKDYVAFQNRLVRDTYEGEPDDVKERAREHCSAHVESDMILEDDEEDLPDEEKKRRSTIRFRNRQVNRLL